MYLSPHALSPVPLQDVSIDDPFWSPKLKTLREVTLPDVLAKFERDGALTNFDRVRDHQTGGHSGPPWYDGLVYETMRAASDIMAAHYDAVLNAALHTRLEGYIARIAAAAAMDPNGYLNTYTQLERPEHRFGQNGGDQIWQHDLYNAGALIEAAVHHVRATGQTNLLRVAARYASHLSDVMGPQPRRNIVPEHPLPEEALVKLYLLFREQPTLHEAMGFPVDVSRFLQLVEFWLEQRGRYEGRVPLSIPQCGATYAQDHQPLLQQETAEGHAVRAALLYTGLVAAAMVNRRDDYFRAALRLWDNAVHRRMHITGSVGSNQSYEGFGPDYFLPEDAYLETCAAVGMGFFHQAMTLAFANGRFADELERSLYNGVLTGVSLKGDTYFYENPLTSEGRERWAWHGCPCCPPMLLKILSALGSYIYAYDETGLYVNLYIGSHATFNLQGKTVHLSQRTAYPWEEETAFTFELPEPARFELALRIPGWCIGAQVKVNGRTADIAVRNGYARLIRTWQTGDHVELRLPLPVQRIEAHPLVEAARGKRAIMRGPLVYAMEGIDNPRPTDLILAADPRFTTEWRPDVLGGVRIVRGESADGSRWSAIPFYAIGNRGKTPMRVWLRQTLAPNISTVQWSQEELYRTAAL